MTFCRGKSPYSIHSSSFNYSSRHKIRVQNLCMKNELIFAKGRFAICHLVPINSMYPRQKAQSLREEEREGEGAALDK